VSCLDASQKLNMFGCIVWICEHPKVVFHTNDIQIGCDYSQIQKVCFTQMFERNVLYSINTGGDPHMGPSFV
jgi:hypothetical protein